MENAQQLKKLMKGLTIGMALVSFLLIPFEKGAKQKAAVEASSSISASLKRDSVDTCSRLR